MMSVAATGGATTNMTLTNLSGVVILTLIFLGIFVAMAKATSVKEAALVWLFSLSTTALITFAVFCIFAK